MSACTNRVEDPINDNSDAAAGHAAPNGRDAQGRFTSANAGGPGNPFGRHTAALRVALLNAVTDEDMQAVMRKLIEMAASGHVQAMKLFLQYTVGKPTPAPNPDQVELDEWDYFKKTAAMSDDVPTVVKSLEPEVVLNMGREMRPIMSELQVQRLKKALDTGDVDVLYGKRSHETASAGAPSPNGDFGEQESETSVSGVPPSPGTPGEGCGADC